MKNVYIINRGCHDFEDAKRFGNLIYLSAGSFNVLSTSRMYRKFSDALKNSSPTDYIIPTGLNTMSIIACSIFVLKHRRLNLLLFYTKNGKGQGSYRERTVLFEKGEITE